jgi:hypothetical protein
MRFRVLILLCSSVFVLLLIVAALLIISHSQALTPTPTATALEDFVATYRATIDAINTEVWDCFNRGDCLTSTPH